jgi:ABC-2 type transport system permease protein
MNTNNAVLHLLRRNLVVISRNRAALMFTIFQPILWMALFSQNFRRIADFAQFRELGYTSYLSFFLPSIMVLTVLNGSALSGISTITDINAGVMDKFAISPIRRSSILLGRILADVIAMAAQCLVVIAIAFAMGARVKTGVAGVALTLLLTLILGSCTASFSDYIALRTRNAQLTMVVSGISTLPLLLLAPAFFPEELQTGWLKTAEKFNPVAYVIDSGQHLLNVGYDGKQLAACFGVLALAALLSFSATIRAFRRATDGSVTAPSTGNRMMAHIRAQQPGRVDS